MFCLSLLLPAEENCFLSPLILPVTLCQNPHPCLLVAPSRGRRLGLCQGPSSLSSPTLSSQTLPRSPCHVPLCPSTATCATWYQRPMSQPLGLSEEGQIIPILCRAARLLLKQLHISGTTPGWGVDHSRASTAPKGNDPQRKIRHKISARNQSCGMPLLTASSTAVDRNKPAQLSLWSWRWAMGRQDVWGWTRGKDFLLCENIQFHH